MRCLPRIPPVSPSLLLCITLLGGCGGGGGGDGGDDNSGAAGTSGSGSGAQQSQSAGSGGGQGTAVAAKFSVSGTVTVIGGTTVDSDVNDPLANYVANDSPATAQFVPTPSTVGGYVNQPSKGPDGRSKVAGDVADMYQVALAAGQPVALYIASDGVEDDLDLFLTDLNGDQVFTSDGLPIRSIGSTEFETLSAESTGSYIVVVSAHAGAARYILTAGQTLDSTPKSAAPEYVPGELLVEFHDSLRVFGGKWLGSAIAREFSMSADGGGAQPTMRFSLDRDVPRARYWKDFGLGHLLAAGAIPTDPDPARQLRLDTPLLAKALARQRWARSVALNFVRTPLLVPNDPLYPQQWHYTQIGLPEAWDSVPATSDIIVAVADTGFMLTHPDLAGRFVDGYDFVSNVVSAADGDGVDPDPSDPGDRAVRGTSTYHGTHVAGTIGAATNNGVGVAGVAWNTKLMPLRVIGRNGASDFDLIQALRYAARLSNVSGGLPPRRADIINLSLGGPGLSRILENALADVRNAGVIIVASAGNNATNAPHYPAAAPGVIAVSALDIQGDLAPYSNFGPFIDIAAPGGDLLTDLNSDGESDGVLSTLINDTTSPATPTYDYREGTSMAAPHVTGVIALMLSIRPSTTPEEMDAYLTSGIMTEDLGAAGRDDLFGHGRIDAFKAVSAAAVGPPPPPPELALDPMSINFGVALTSAKVRAANAGGGTLTAVAGASDASWLSVAPLSIDADGLGDYRINVDRSGLADGTYMGNLTFTSSRNATGVSVIMQVAVGMDLSDDAGRHFVVLMDSDTLTMVAELSSSADQGRYAFRFDEVPPGSYYVVAGSDADNDKTICTSGEACGVLTTDSEPSIVQVDRNMTGLDFTTRLDLSPPLGDTTIGKDGVTRSDSN